MIGLLVDAERREAAVVGRAEAFGRDEVRRPDQRVAHLLGALHPRVLRVDHADVGELRHAVRVVAEVLADQPVDVILVPLAGELDQEVAGVHHEHARQQVVVVDVGAVHRVAVAARAGVDADLRSLLGAESGQHPVVELDKVRQHAPAGPRVAGICPGGQAALGEVDGHSRRASGECLPDVLLALVDEVFLEALPRVAGNVVVQRVQQRQHGRGDHGLLHRLAGQPDRLAQRVRRVGLVPERPAGEPRQLPPVPVGKDREVLAPVPGQLVGKPGSGQGVGDRVRREARPPLLAVGDDRLAGRLPTLDRVPDRLVLLSFELIVGDLPGVVLAIRLLQLARARQRADRFGRDSRRGARIVVSHGIHLAAERDQSVSSLLSGTIDP